MNSLHKWWDNNKVLIASIGLCLTLICMNIYGGRV